jgi:hypothetical protein
MGRSDEVYTENEEQNHSWEGLGSVLYMKG